MKGRLSLANLHQKFGQYIREWDGAFDGDKYAETWNLTPDELLDLCIWYAAVENHNFKIVKRRMQQINAFFGCDVSKLTPKKQYHGPSRWSR